MLRQTKREIILETTAWATHITKISMGAPSRERSVLLHAWPDGDFLENTRGSQRVKKVSKNGIDQFKFYNG